MTRRSIGRIVPTALALALAVSAGAAAIGKQASDSGVAYLVDASGASRGAAGETQQKGRYKKQGDNCVWDANDSGADQCTPQTRGRFKKQGGSCVWDANDLGPDQCRPPKGRFKKEGDRCVWSAKDSGPDQCNPKQPR
jgi:hypothetical protein